MLIITVIALGILAALNRRLGRSWLYPPALFCAAWVLFLTGLMAAGDFFYPISGKTLLIYFTGAAAFSAGGLVVAARRQDAVLTAPTADSGLQPWARKLLAAGVPIYVALFPFYWNFMKELGESMGYRDIWKGIRARTIQLSAAGGDPRPEALFFGNLVVVAMVFAMITFRERARSNQWRWLSLSYLILALVYSMLSTSSAYAVFILLFIAGIVCVQSARIRFTTLLISLLIIALAFGTLCVVLEKGSARTKAPLASNVRAVAELVELYVLGGLVGFDQVVRFPGSIPPNWRVNRFFLQTANKLGASFDVPPIHNSFTMVSSTLSTNVYTLYFAYYADFGWPGTLLFLFALGASITLIYYSALKGRPIATLLYGIAFAGILLSSFCENFFLALNFVLKTVLVAAVLYGAPFRRREKATLEREISFLEDRSVYRWS